MKSWAVTSWILLVCLLGAAYASFVVWRRASPPEPARTAATVTTPRLSPQAATSGGPVADFVLTDQDGHEFDSRTLRGKVWVASFFFTNCPAACWRMNQALSAFQETHPDSQAHFVSITCDPANDTPEALAKYSQHFKADPQRWTFLTGDMPAIRSIGQDSFKIAVVEKDHSDRACVVDRQGQVRGRFRLTEPDQVAMLERLLAVVEAEGAEQQHEAPNPPPDSPPAQGKPDDHATAALPSSE